MKNLVVNYRIINDKICDKNILLLSDLHDYKFNRNSSLIDDIKKEDSDLIVISGDILNTSKKMRYINYKKELKYFLSAISEKSPVFLGIGNHDLLFSENEKIDNYKDLENSRNGKVFALNNESINYQDMRITEFHPDHDAFSPSFQKNGIGLLLFKNDYEKSGIKIPQNDKLFNILICHNPKFFEQALSIGNHLDFDLDEEDFANLISFSSEMSKYDLCLSGHLHNGYIPLSLTMKNPSKYMDNGYWEMPIERDINRNIKFVRPWVFEKTNLCRGTIFVSNAKQRIIELSDGSYYYKDNLGNAPVQITEEELLNINSRQKLTPIVISGGVNKYFNLPIDNAEITKVKLLKK